MVSKANINRVCSSDNCNNKSYSKDMCSNCRMKLLARYNRRIRKKRGKRAEIRNRPKGEVFVLRGEQHKNAKLKEENVIEIYKSKEDRKSLALKYEITIRNVDMIRSGKRWAWLTKDIEK